MTYHPRCVQVQRTLSHPPTPHPPHPPPRSRDVPSQMCSSPKNVITPPHPPPPPPNPSNQHHAKKTTKNGKKRGFTEAKRTKTKKMGLSLWRRCSEIAKTLFREAAFCARPANYNNNYYNYNNYNYNYNYRTTTATTV